MVPLGDIPVLCDSARWSLPLYLQQARRLAQRGRATAAATLPYLSPRPQRLIRGAWRPLRVPADAPSLQPLQASGDLR